MNKPNAIRSITLASAFAAFALPALAYWTPIQINLAGAAGLPPAAESVYGLRLNALYGRCDNVVLFDVGLFNRTEKSDYALRAGAFNWAKGEACGITVGAFNFDACNDGLTVGAFNGAKDGAGVTIGAINFAETFGGLQIGAVNIASEKFTGLQIGVLNFNGDSVIPVFPLFNMGSGSSK